MVKGTNHMTAVGIRSGVKYGFLLMGYFIGVFIIGGLLSGAGILVASSDSIALTIGGGLLALIGVVIIYAGSMGVLYKVIADGVETGVAGAVQRSKS